MNAHILCTEQRAARLMPSIRRLRERVKGKRGCVGPHESFFRRSWWMGRGIRESQCGESWAWSGLDYSRRLRASPARNFVAGPVCTAYRKCRDAIHHYETRERS